MKNTVNANILLTQKVKKYKGKYIAVAGDQVVVAAADAKDAYYMAKKVLGGKKIEGIYYVPQRQDLLTALCITLIIE